MYRTDMPMSGCSFPPLPEAFPHPLNVAAVTIRAHAKGMRASLFFAMVFFPSTVLGATLPECFENASGNGGSEE
jgi:hypothetical protein